MSVQLSSTVQFPNTADHRPYTLIKPAILDYTVRVIKALSLSDSWFQWAANRIARFYRDQWQNVVFWRGEREGKRWVDFALRFFCFAILNSQKKRTTIFYSLLYTCKHAKRYCLPVRKMALLVPIASPSIWWTSTSDARNKQNRHIFVAICLKRWMLSPVYKN